MDKTDLKQISSREPVPGFRGKFVHSKNVTLGYWDIKAGSKLPEHSHPHEQIANVINGKFEMTVGGKADLLEANSVLVIPSNVKHSGRALTDCYIIDVFYPVREDYK